ncbi:MAG: PKD domain-containing protein [Bacteroidia bacterium]
MKRITTFLTIVWLALIAFSTTITAQSTYCTPSYTGPGFNGLGDPTSFWTHILEVELFDISHAVSAPFANPAPIYRDYTNISTVLTQGQNYPITVKLGNGANDQTLAVWIDFNQNKIFETTEMVFTKRDTSGIGDHTARGIISVPVGAVLGSTRMRVGTLADFTPPAPCQNNGGFPSWSQHFHDYTIDIEQQQTQSFESATCTHSSLQEVTPGSSNNQILRIEVRNNPHGVLSPLSAGDFDLSTIGTSNPLDIERARLYYTGQNPNFSTAQQVGSTVSNPSAFYTITANQELKAGSNYFWLVYDIDEDAIIGNVIDARCNSVEVNFPRIPDVISPPGSRRVGYCVSVGEQSNFLYVSRVQIGNINNSTFYGNGYSNYTYLSTEVTRGLRYPLSLLFGNSVNPGIGRAWIDFNRDGDFDDPGEMVMGVNWMATAANPNFTPVTDTITIPANAVVGPTRMRVSIQYTPAPGPCTNPVQIGEAEDYSIMIAEAGQPVADFIAVPACLGSPTDFVDESYTFGSFNITSWKWNFGDGDSSDSQNPSHTYSSPGVYNVTLTVNSNMPGTPSTVKRSIKVNDPKADFSYNQTIFQTPIRFTDQTEGGVVISWFWDFGATNSMGQRYAFNESPTHVFDTVGTYDVMLVVTTEGNCRDTIIKSVTIVDEVSPIADFNADTYNPYIGAATNLIDASLHAPTSWKWRFQPNSVSFYENTSDTSQFPVVSFDNLTTYTVKLIASNGAGSDSATKVFITKNYTAPVADFLATPDTVKAGQIVSFVDLSTNDPTSWRWAFGDGDSAFVKNPLHQYVNPGAYNIYLRSANPAGSSVRTKSNYVYVDNKYRLCESDAPYSPLYIGHVYDSGDSAANYNSNSNCGFLIAPPCAGPITLTFTSFNFANDDFIRIYDGTDNTGIPLHSGNGFSGSSIPSAITAYSGNMYIEEVTDAFTTSSGFAANWFAVPNIRPRARITGDTVAYVNSPVYFYDGTTLGTGNTYEWDTDGDGATDGTTPNVKATYSATGSYTVRLIVSNCKGRDTAYHTIQVRNPTLAPVSDFIVTNDTVPVFSLNDTVLPLVPIRFLDLSTNGPTQWHWEVEPQGLSFFDMGTSETSQNPIILFFEEGKYTITLTASNSIGTGTVERKVDYIYVKGKGSLCTFPFQSFADKGVLTDDGTESANYNNNTNCDYLLDPCGDRAFLKFTEFEFALGDVLRVYDGEDASGIPFHTGNGFTGTNLPPPLVSNSGKFYIEQVTDAFTTAKGFIAEWSSEPPDPPVADFSAPDTGYTGGAVVRFNNRSTGPDNLYEWDFENDGTVDETTVNAEHQFATAGVYNVRLQAENCRTSDVMIKSIRIIDPTAPPGVDFSASMLRAALSDTIRFTDLSDNGPSGWKWTVTPDNVNFINGTADTSSDPQVKFTQTGTYAVKLVARNILGEDSLERTAYITIFDYCTPSVNNITADIGISRVQIGDIDNSSETGKLGYTDYTGIGTTSLTRRGIATIRVERASIANDMTRKVWIDYNQDGVFDTTELAAEEQPAKTMTWTQSFQIPGSALLGPTRMRVATNLAGNANIPCGPHAFGEFEDYRVTISLDNTPPIITLLGNNPDTVEIGYPYNDPGATAFDDLDGNITSKIVVVSNVDTGATGVYQISYNITDSAGNEAEEVIRTVVVVKDHTKPVITLLGDNPFILSVYSSFNDPGATAIDNRSGDVTSQITTQSNIDSSRIGDYQVIYTAYDAEGNFASVVRDVKVVDTAAPVITLLGPTEVTMKLVDMPYIDPGYLINDNYYDSADITVTISGTYSDTVTVAKTYVISYTAKDPSGNSSTELRLITLESNIGITEDGNNLSLGLFPNPNTGRFNLNIEMTRSQPLTLEITDLQGRLLWQQQLAPAQTQQVNLDVRHLSSGYYLLKATGTAGTKILPVQVLK